MNCVMLSNVYGVMNMILKMQSLLISDDNCRYEAVASDILKGFYFS